MGAGVVYIYTQCGMCLCCGLVPLLDKCPKHGIIQIVDMGYMVESEEMRHWELLRTDCQLVSTRNNPERDVLRDKG
jgi:hypothetical protein